MQVLSQAQADALPFDILDPTKLIPEELHPTKIVGRMVLDRNPDNVFAETEQVAFLPTNTRPGIDVSEDPLPQSRLFSYQDTQLSRLGTVNFHQLSIDQAKACPFQNMQCDGHMQMQKPQGRANYEPNSVSDAGEIGGPREDPQGGFRSTPVPVDGAKTRLRSESFADHYTQARLFYRSQTQIEQAHLASALVFELSKCSVDHVRVRVLGNLQNVDADLAQRVADGLNVPLPPKNPAAVEPVDMKPSPALRIVGKYPQSLMGRTVGVLVSDGVDGALVKAVRNAAEAEGAKVVIVAPKIGGVILESGKLLKAKC